MRRIVSFGPFLLIAVLTACGPSEYDKYRQADNEKNIARCEQLGGYPIRSVWDGQMTDCKAFPKIEK